MGEEVARLSWRKCQNGSPAAFEFVECSVDGRPRRARRAGRTGAQVFTVHLGADAMTTTQPLTVSYTYRVLVQQQGHLLHLDISRPTKGLTVQFSYGGRGIRYVNVLDYVAKQPAAWAVAAARRGTDAEHRVALRRVGHAESWRGLRVGARGGDDRTDRQGVGRTGDPQDTGT